MTWKEAMRGFLVIGVLLTLAGSAVPAGAHGLSTSYTEISITPTRLEVTCLLSINEIFTHFPIGGRSDERVGLQELDTVVAGVFAFLGEHLTLTVDGTPVVLERGPYHAYPGATFVRLELSRPLERAPAELALVADAVFFERFGSQHVNLVKVAGGSGQVQQAAMTSDTPRAAFVVGYGSLPAQCAAFIKLGIRHIFLGYDHVVFLLVYSTISPAPDLPSKHVALFLPFPCVRSPLARPSNPAARLQPSDVRAADARTAELSEALGDGNGDRTVRRDARTWTRRHFGG
jgi:hypothetical protein